MAFNSVWLGYEGQANLVDAYLNSAWSADCRALRGGNMDFTGVNYATFWVQTPGGIAAATQPSAGGFHSEKQVWFHINGTPGLDAIDLPSWRAGEGAGMPKQTANAVAAAGTQVLAVYTERQPCGTCSPFLNDALPDNTPVYWHFPWPSAETKKHKHDDESIGSNALMAISRGVDYDTGAKSYQRTDRVEGNKGLASAQKKMKTKSAGAGGHLPWLGVSGPQFKAKTRLAGKANRRLTRPSLAFASGETGRATSPMAKARRTRLAAMRALAV